MISEKTLLLDVGDTLVKINEPFEKYTKKAISSVLESLNKFDDKVLLDFLELRNNIRALAHQNELETNISTFLKEGASKFLNLNLEKEELEKLELIYIDAELAITEVFVDTMAFLDNAKNNGRSMFVTTNNFSQLHVNSIVERFDFDKYISGIHISGVCGYRKPNPKFLQTFFEKFNTSPDDCVIIGDKYNLDVLSGKSIGIKTCLLNRKDADQDMTSGPPDYLYNSLSEIEFD